LTSDVAQGKNRKNHNCKERTFVAFSKQVGLQLHCINWKLKRKKETCGRETRRAAREVPPAKEREKETGGSESEPCWEGRTYQTICGIRGGGATWEN